MALRDRARKVSGSSRLEIGRQYTTEEILAVDSVVFTDVDYVAYVDKTTGDNVCYSVWKIDKAKNGHWGKTAEDGYYRGGAALTELYAELFADSENPECAENLEELHTAGFEVALVATKTKKGQNFVKVVIP